MLRERVKYTSKFTKYTSMFTFFSYVRFWLRLRRLETNNKTLFHRLRSSEDTAERNRKGCERSNIEANTRNSLFHQDVNSGDYKKTTTKHGLSEHNLTLVCQKRPLTTAGLRFFPGNRGWKYGDLAAGVNRAGPLS